jgi:hypothetical protein
MRPIVQAHASISSIAVPSSDSSPKASGPKSSPAINTGKTPFMRLPRGSSNHDDRETFHQKHSSSRRRKNQPRRRRATNPRQTPQAVANDAHMLISGEF